MVAFEAAFAAGADAIELDVRLTSDGVPVILHDADVAAATNGSGFVHEMTLAEVKRLDASGGAGDGAEVPTLEEVLETIGDRGGVDIEIKNLPGEPAFDSPREAILEATLETLASSPFRGPVLISSFNWLTIERCKQLAPEIPTGFLTIAPIDAHAALVYTRTKGHDFVLPQTPALLEAGEGLVREAHEQGVRVGTWVADEESVLETLFRWGVDAIACNDPASAVAIRDRLAQ